MVARSHRRKSRRRRGARSLKYRRGARSLTYRRGATRRKQSHKSRRRTRRRRKKTLRMNTRRHPKTSPLMRRLHRGQRGGAKPDRAALIGLICTGTDTDTDTDASQTFTMKFGKCKGCERTGDLARYWYDEGVPHTVNVCLTHPWDQGACGYVFYAKKPSRDRCAIKVVNNSPEALRELKILGKMKSIHDETGCPVLGGKPLKITVNPHSSDVLVIDTPFFNGNTLSEAVKTEGFATHVPWVILELLFTVAHINDQEYMHGDIKPGNILVSDDGEVKLIDFGFTCERSQDGFIQGDNIIVNFGTPSYLSLEILQALRRKGRIPTGGDHLNAMKKIDSYALAITMFNLLSRKSHLPGVTTLGSIAPTLQAGRKKPKSSVFELIGGLTEAGAGDGKVQNIPMGRSCDIITILNGMGCIDPQYRKTASDYASQLRGDCITDATLYARTYKAKHGEERTHPIDGSRWKFPHGTIDHTLVDRYLGISIVNGGTYTGAAAAEVVELPGGEVDAPTVAEVAEVADVADVAEVADVADVAEEAVPVDGESGSMTEAGWKSKTDIPIPNQPHLDLEVIKVIKQGGDLPILSPEAAANVAAYGTMGEKLAETDKNEVTRILLRMSKAAHALIIGLNSELKVPVTSSNEAAIDSSISRTCAKALILDDPEHAVGLGKDVSYDDFVKCAQYQKNTIGHGPTGPPPSA